MHVSPAPCPVAQPPAPLPSRSAGRFSVSLDWLHCTGLLVQQSKIQRGGGELKEKLGIFLKLIRFFFNIFLLVKRKPGFVVEYNGNFKTDTNN